MPLGAAIGHVAAEDAAKLAAEDAAKVGAEDAAKVASKDAAKAGAEDAAKTASKDAAKTAAEDAAKNAAEDAAKNASKLSAKDAAKYAAGAAAAGLGLYTYIQSNDAADKSNSTPRTITQVQADSGTAVKITFTPALRIVMNDQLTITGSKTMPSIDGSSTPTSVITDSQIIIDPGVHVSSFTPGGTITVKTSTGNQASDSVAQAAKTVGTGAGGAGADLLSGLFSGLGLDQYATYIEWGCGILCILISCAILAYIVMKFKK
jgi:hypothetical protein